MNKRCNKCIAYNKGIIVNAVTFYSSSSRLTFYCSNAIVLFFMYLLLSKAWLDSLLAFHSAMRFIILLSFWSVKWAVKHPCIDHDHRTAQQTIQNLWKCHSSLCTYIDLFCAQDQNFSLVRRLLLTLVIIKRVLLAYSLLICFVPYCNGFIYMHR